MRLASLCDHLYAQTITCSYMHRCSSQDRNYVHLTVGRIIPSVPGSVQCTDI